MELSIQLDANIDDARERLFLLRRHEVLIREINELANLGRQLVGAIEGEGESLNRLHSLIQTRKELANR